MSDPSQQCPSVWREITTPHRVCGRRSGKLRGVTYTTGSEQYDQGCGRIKCCLPVGTCWFRLWFFNYLDGISVTHGSLRQHIWSFIGGYDEQSRSCPCVNGSTVGSSIPSFVGHTFKGASSHCSTLALITLQYVEVVIHSDFWYSNAKW